MSIVTHFRYYAASKSLLDAAKSHSRASGSPFNASRITRRPSLSVLERKSFHDASTFPFWWACEDLFGRQRCFQDALKTLQNAFKTPQGVCSSLQDDSKSVEEPEL